MNWRNDTPPTPAVLVSMEEQPEALSEGWRLFLTEIRQLAAEARSRRTAAAITADNDSGAKTQRA